jgi:hypothetical protein
VESALAAGLGIVIDRRIVSVAQIRRDSLEDAAPAGTGADADADAEPIPGDGEADVEPVPPEQRVVFLGWDARTQPNARTECRVRVQRESAEYSGTGTGAGTTQGRAAAAARAVFAAIALARGAEDLVLEDAKLVDAHGRTYVLVAARALVGRQSRPLTGVAPLTHSPEEAAILASLQATNRWTGTDA